MKAPSFTPLTSYREYAPEEMQRRAAEFRAEMQRRRTVRQFAARPIAPQIIADALLAAGTAPSGANLQPWHFVVITDPARKAEIRVAAEAEEHEFYHTRAPQEWLGAVPDCHLRAKLWRVAGWPQGQELLCERIGRHCDRHFDYGLAHGGAGDAHPYAESDELSESDLRAPGPGKALPLTRRRLPGRRGRSACHHEKNPRRNCHFFIERDRLPNQIRAVDVFFIAA
jgi:hypothetical protein